MLFNSIEFAIFLPIVFIVYWLSTYWAPKFKNIILLISSYYFYGVWDSRFLILIIASTLLDYFIGLSLEKTFKPSKRKLLLGISIVFNLGLLGVFKYFNFFLDNISTAFRFFGNELDITSIHIVLPVGISFYTFQTLSYSIDVYNKKIESEKNIISFATFVAFFPQLVAGPIERASHFLPQFRTEKKFSYVESKDGLRQILWGLFKKVVIADNCALFVNEIFANNEILSGSTLVVGALLFSFQIYYDFSGYSDIAIGSARLLGFDLRPNFNYPYFSKDISEFWRRWHISLSTWFRDYVYIPLGGSRVSKIKSIRNVLIIFLVSGFWHGANWTFLIWGLIHGLLFIPILLNRKSMVNIENIKNQKWFVAFKDALRILFTFITVSLCWIFFRAESISHAMSYFSGIFDVSLFTTPSIFPIYLIFLLIFTLTVEWLGRLNLYPLEKSDNLPIVFRWGFYYFLIILLFNYAAAEQSFIYFQF